MSSLFSLAFILRVIMYFVGKTSCRAAPKAFWSHAEITDSPQQPGTERSEVRGGMSGGSEGLKIGDYITLKVGVLNSYLGGEGIFVNDVFVDENISRFDDYVFCIHIQKQYNASKELSTFLSTYNVDEEEDPKLQKYLVSLRRGQRSEETLNVEYMQRKAGNPVLFGDIIQLYHVKSRKYVTVLPNVLGRDERENLSILLDTNGNSCSWLKVMPRFNIDREGDQIQSSTEVYLQVVDRKNEFIHCADRKPPVGLCREVNSSLEVTSWRAVIYQDYTNTIDKSLLLTSQIIQVYESETRFYFCIEDCNDKTNKKTQLTLKPKNLNGLDDSSSFWILESKKIVVGGPLQWKTETVRLRHVNTGLYLNLLEQGPPAAERLAENFEFTTTGDPSHPGALFQVVEVNSTKSVLSNGKALQINRDGVWMKRGALRDDMTLGVCATLDASAAVSILVERFESDELSNEPLDVHVGLAAKTHLSYYADLMSIPKSSSGTSVFPITDAKVVGFYYKFMSMLKAFTNGLAVSEFESMSRGEALLVLKRQSLAREQGLLLLAITIIEKLIPLANLSETTMLLGKKLSESTYTLFAMAQEILGASFDLIISCIDKNPENQLYVANRLSSILSHLSFQPVSAKIVTIMLSTNLELQETKISAAEISVFVDKLRKSKMNPMYLELLRSCCSCQGAGVDGNQCKVADILFSNANDVLITLTLDRERNSAPVKTLEDISNSLYIKPTDKETRGSEMLIKGYQPLLLSWSSKYQDMTPLALFGKSTVDFSTLFRDNSPVIASAVSSSGGKSAKVSRRIISTGGKSDIEEQKNVVMNYFVSQMLLGAEMCLDRNYVAMHRLDSLFPYEVLLVILLMDINPKVKSAAIYLMQSLHVDRDPQAGVKIPCLTRVWRVVQEEEVPSMPKVSDEEEYKFGVIQEYVSSYIKGMAGTQWNELSVSVIGMLKCLMTFNFYGTEAKMRDVIEPLLRAIDRRNLSYDRPVVTSRKMSYRAARAKKTAKVAVTDKADGESKEEEVVEEEKVMWEETVFNFLESLPVIVAILVLTLAAVATTIAQMVQSLSNDPNAMSDIEGSPLYVWGLIVMSIFIAEFSARLYCFWRFRGNPIKFLKKKLVQVDILVILIDIVLLALPTGGEAKVAKILRLLRMTRLLRILKAAKVMARLHDMMKVNKSPWSPPLRYSETQPVEIDAAVASIDVLLLALNVIDDRSLSILLRKFYMWERGDEKKTPSQLFDEAVEQSAELSLRGHDLDMILLDNIMFNSSALTQKTLELLMCQHTSRRRLLTNLSSLQLVITAKREGQFYRVSEMFKQLERNAETHELWGELESAQDIATNEQTKQILTDLIDMSKTRRLTLELNEEFEVENEVQVLYRNLDCFNICLKILGLLDSVEEDDDGTLSEVCLNTRELVRICNTLLYWFMLDNSANQELGFSHLEFFINSLDASIGSHTTIRAIFKGNEKLMMSIEYTILNDLLNKIIEDGKKSQYLTLFASITNVGDKNMTNNQFEIIKCLTSPGRLERVALFLVPPGHPEYEEKRALMRPFLGKDDCSVDDLPEPLAYHLTLLEVMANCTVGRLNITTVEAKVQSVFNFAYVVNSILDPDTILLAKIRSSLFLLNAVIEVEMKIPGLEQEGCIWRLLESYVDVLQYAKDYLRLLEKVGWDSPSISRSKVEYIMCSILLIDGFFNRYYDAVNFRLGDGAMNKDRVHLNMGQINDLISTLFGYIKDIYDMGSINISMAHKALMFSALKALNQSIAGRILCANLVETHKDNVVKEDMPISGQAHSDMITRQQFARFVNSLSADKECQDKADNQISDFVKTIEHLPFVADNIVSDLRYEAVIRKLIVSISENIEYVNDEKRLNATLSSITVWVVRAFRLMIENKMGMSIFQRDEEGGEEQDEATAPVIKALCSMGAVPFALDLIAPGINDEIRLECIKFCVGMLFKEGGAKDIQVVMNEHLMNGKSLPFFRQCRITLQSLCSWHRWHGVHYLAEGDELQLPKEILLVRMLQLMSEGHFLDNQELMRSQPNNAVNVNLLDDFATYVDTLSRLQCQTSTQANLAILATVLEVLQGPCPGNQVYLSVSTELLESLNRILRLAATGESDCVPADELDMKKTSVEILQALVEGQGLKSAVYERMFSVVHMDIIYFYAKPALPGTSVGEEGSEENTEEAVPEEEAENAEALKTECNVLLQTFYDRKPSLKEEICDDSDRKDTGTVSVEIMWRGELQRRFFAIPSICSELAPSSRKNLVQEVDRSNLESKLGDFVGRSLGLYNEIKHQEVLINLGVATVFSPTVKERLTWMTFILTLVINGLFIGYYTNSDGIAEPSVSDDILTATFGLNIVQVILSSFVLILNVVVRLPVVYKAASDEGLSAFECITACVQDTMTVYYVGYLVVSVLGVVLKDYYVPFLLLDIIVKNATTQNVVKAVYLPRKMLLAAFLLGLFVLYIYSYYIFLFFRGYPTDGDCQSLWGCFKFTLVYGMMYGGGIGDGLEHNIGIQRIILDLSFFLLITIVLLNIIFGIIIDTFGSLRDAKDELQKDKINICFICGIEKQVLDRASSEPDGFKRHIEEDHNMWNYLYFIVFLQENDKDDDDGLEYYVRHCIDNDDITWFPLNKAMKLAQESSKAETMREDVLSHLQLRTKVLTDKISHVKVDVRSVLSSLRDVTKHDFGTIADAEGIKIAVASKLEAIVQQKVDFAMVANDSDNEDDKKGGENAKQDEKQDDEEVDMNQLGKHIFFQIVDMASIDGFQQDEVHAYSIRILCESGMYSIASKSIDASNKIVFDSDTCIICENTLPDDFRTCRVQVLQTAVGNQGIARFVANIEFKTVEILQQGCDIDEFVLSKEFNVDGKVFTLKFKVITMEAKNYGLDENEGWEESDD